MRLSYLDFDYSEDADGIGTLEAVASTWPAQVPAVQAEIVQLLGWAHAAFAGQRGPVGEGGDWDYDLQGMQEFTAPVALHYDEVTGQLAAQVAPPGLPRHTVTVSISGTAAFCAAFRQQFALD